MERDSASSSSGSDPSVQKRKKGVSMIIDGSQPMTSHVKSQITMTKLDCQSKAPSLQCSKQELILFDKFIRCKQEDKPKDTLAWLTLKRQQFQHYVNMPSNQWSGIPCSAVDFKHLHHDISMPRYYQCTIRRDVQAGAALIVRITPCQPSKCNIVVHDAEGNVIKYYPSAFLIKKKQKIIKIAQEYCHSPIILLDYSFKEVNQQYFHSLYRKPRSVAYHIFNICPQDLQICLKEAQELQVNGTIKFQILNSPSTTLIINSSHNNASLQAKEQLQGIVENFNHIYNDQQSFLNEFRGIRQQKDRNLDFDLLGKTLWRQSKAGASLIISKIIKLYKMKEETIMEQSKVPLPSALDLHMPHKMKKQQNCLLCQSKFPNIKPKRTNSVCTACSAQKERPFYLCKKCFGEYHRNPDIHIFKKNQKKTRKILRDIRKKEREAEVGQEQEGLDKEMNSAEMVQANKRQSLRLFEELQKMTEQVFEKIDNLLEDQQDNNLKPCQFYLSMMLNNNIRCMGILQAKIKESPQSDPPA